MKKLINLFLMIAQLPINTTQLLMESNSQTSTASSANISIVTAQGNQSPPTMKELQSLDEATIDDYENHNALWIYRFAKLRAMQIMAQMKELGKSSTTSSSAASQKTMNLSIPLPKSLQSV